MALSTMKYAARLRPALMGGNSLFAKQCLPMATSSTDQMKEFWEKNQRLGRPNSPWIIYKPHIPMITSLTHRVTGIAMGVALYGIGVGLFIAPGDFPHYIDMIKNLEISPLIMFPFKTMCAFPLVYHTINGVRHLSWDAGYGMELKTMYKTGYSILISSALLAAFLASISYII